MGVLSPAAARLVIREADFRPDVADIYVDPRTGLMLEYSEHLGANVRLKTIVRAVGQEPEGARGTLILRVSGTERLTALGGVTIERPTSVGTVSRLSFLGV
jgi:hypothetical protein